MWETAMMRELVTGDPPGVVSVSSIWYQNVWTTATLVHVRCRAEEPLAATLMPAGTGGRPIATKDVRLVHGPTPLGTESA
jgi:hypothetical protein